MDRQQPFARWLDETNDVLGTFLAASQKPGLINLGGGLPDPTLFPSDALAEISARVLRDHPVQTMGYGPVQGLPCLRQLIAERMSADGLHITSENVLITTGSTQALSLIGMAFLDPGDAVAVQFPTYLGALDAFRPREPEMRNLDLQSTDLDMIQTFADAKFAYTVPNFSNPTGRLVDQVQREHILAAAHQTGTWVVEDDPYGMLHFDSAPVPSMLSLSSKGSGAPYNGRCIYLGSLSKQLSPGLRVAWIVASPPVIAALSMAKQAGDMCTSGLTQMIAYEAFATGLVDRLLPKTVDLYRARRDAFCDAMEDHLTDLFEWERPSGGMFVWARAKTLQINTDTLVEYGLREGVLVSPSRVFDSQNADRTALRLNFTLNEPEALREALRRLSVATRAMLAEDARVQRSA